VKAKRVFLELVETTLSSIVVLLVLYMTVALPEMVWGSSMEPTFNSEDRIIVDRLTKRFNNDFKRGEVIVFKPNDSSRHLIKRVIGIPGDIIKIYSCNVFVSKNGERYKLSEPYLTNNTCTEGGSIIKEGRSVKLGEEEYVVLGDNRAVSMDSRSLGLISSNDIVGRVVFRFWPASKIGFVR